MDSSKQVPEQLREAAIAALMNSMECLFQPPSGLSELEKALRVRKTVLISDSSLGSLSMVELCVYLELNHDVVVLPEEIVKCTEFEDLLKIVTDRMIMNKT